MTELKQGGWTYTLTPEDKLWAARMIQYEGPASDSAAVLWTMAQLFSPAGQQAKYGGRRYATFADQLKAYSQPINPIWRRDGSKCRPGGSHHGQDACSPARLDRRDQAARLPYGSVDAEKRAVLERWLGGSVPNPVPGAFEFAHASVLGSDRIDRLGLVARSSSGNLFLGSRAGLTPVEIGGGAAATVLLLAGAAVATWLGVRWWKRRRARGANLGVLPGWAKRRVVQFHKKIEDDLSQGSHRCDAAHETLFDFRDWAEDNAAWLDDDDRAFINEHAIASARLIRRRCWN